MADPIEPVAPEAPAPGGVASVLYPEGGGAKPNGAEPPAEPVAPAPAEGEPAAPKEPEEPKAPEGEKPAGEPLAPEAYELKLPETIQVDESLLGEFRTLASEVKLDNPSAQKLIDLFGKTMEAQGKAFAEAGQVQFTAMTTQWKTELATLPEMAPDQKARTEFVIGKAMQEFGSPEAAEAFNTSGLGDNPHVVKFVLNMAKMMLEGEPAAQGSPSSKPTAGRSVAQRLYQTD